MSEHRTGRRGFLRAALGGVALVGCDSAHPRAGFLGAMERWNERAQTALFDSA